jgi:hypothetical protein
MPITAFLSAVAVGTALAQLLLLGVRLLQPNRRRGRARARA